MDIKNAKDRSYNMSRIRSEDTKPEIWFRKELFSKGYRYRKNVPYIFGRPDMFLRKYNTAIFINGCFWHRHSGCKYATSPKTRVDFWERKFSANVNRDRNVIRHLLNDHIKVLIIWECSIKRMKKEHEFKSQSLKAVEDFLHSEELYLEL